MRSTQQSPIVGETQRRQSPRARTKAIAIDDRVSRVATAESFADRESIALRRIAATTGHEPYAVLQGLLLAAVELCGGGADSSTAGVSMLEPAPDGGEQFRWVAMAGCLASHIGGTTPRGFSPCGECLDAGRPILLSRPDIKYEYFQSTGLEFTEGMVLPFSPDPRAMPLGTIWVVSHPPRRHHFAAEDVRLMASLAHFAASAYCLATERDEADGMKRRHQGVVASASQEMRTPLNTIAGSVYLLLLETQGALTNGQVEHLARIQNAVKQLQDGVDGLSESAASDLRQSPQTAKFQTPHN